MARRRREPPLELSALKRQQLQELARSRSYPFSIVQRTQIVLACESDCTDKAVAEHFNVTNNTVGKWRRRFVEQGIAGLHDASRPVLRGRSAMTRSWS